MKMQAAEASWTSIMIYSLLAAALAVCGLRAWRLVMLARV
jgi:hypothetical protein